MTDRSTWAARYGAGESTTAIAAADGVSASTVRSHLDAAGVPLRPRGRQRGYRAPGSAWHHDAAAWVARGGRPAEIARHYRVSRQAVHDALQRLQQP